MFYLVNKGAKLALDSKFCRPVLVQSLFQKDRAYLSDGEHVRGRTHCLSHGQHEDTGNRQPQLLHMSQFSSDPTQSADKHSLGSDS